MSPLYQEIPRVFTTVAINIICIRYHIFIYIFQKNLKKFDGIPTANEFEELIKFDDMDADGRFIE